jgi:hypothetical protein
MAKKMGRPTLMTPEKIRQLEAICRLKPTREDCAAFLDVDATTIDKWIERTHGITFSEFREKHMVHTRFMVIRQMLEQCKKGNMAALIFTAKNLCGWVDYRQDPHAEKQQAIELKYTLKKSSDNNKEE